MMKLFYWTRLYRPLMLLLHRFHLHYMRVLPIIDDRRIERTWCEWCGIRGTRHVFIETDTHFLPLANAGRMGVTDVRDSTAWQPPPRVLPLIPTSGRISCIRHNLEDCAVCGPKPFIYPKYFPPAPPFPFPPFVGPPPPPAGKWKREDPEPRSICRACGNQAESLNPGIWHCAHCKRSWLSESAIESVFSEGDKP